MNKTIETATLRHSAKSIETLRDENEALRAKLAKATDILRRACAPYHDLKTRHQAEIDANNFIEEMERETE